MSVDLSQSYPTAEAERGKFAVIDTSTLTGYPSGGRGKYAVLTYSVGQDTSTSTLTSDNAYSQNTIGIEIQGGVNSTITTTVSTFTFANNVRLLEMFNNGAETCYFIVNQTSTVDTLTAQGMLLKSGAFYTLEKSVTGVSLVADTGANDVRIHGHY